MDRSVSLYRDLILSRNPYAYWRMHGPLDSNGRIVDEVANRTMLPSSGGFVVDVPGLLRRDPDTAIEFDGIVGSFRRGNVDANLNGQNFTVEAWARASVDVTGTARAILASRSGNTQGYLLWHNTTDNRMRFRHAFTRDSDGGAAISDRIGNPVIPGELFHVAATVEWPNILGIAMNGEYTHGPAPTNNHTLKQNTVSQFAIGRESAAAFFWPGVIDEVAYYPFVLTAEQIRQSYFAGLGKLTRRRSAGAWTFPRRRVKAGSFA